MNKEQMIDAVKGNLSSIFTKEDVLNMLTHLDTDVEVKSESPDADDVITISKAKLKLLVRDSIHALEYSVGDFIDLDSASFSLEGREVMLDHVDIDYMALADEVIGSLYEELSDL